MKKLLIAKEYYYFLGELANKTNALIRISKSIQYPSNTFAIICDNPTIAELYAELRVVETMGIRLIVIVDSFKYPLYKSLFADTIVIDSSSANIVDDIINGLIDRDRRDIKYFNIREEEFLSELSYGLSLKEVSASMKISDRTTRRIKEKLLDKTGLASSQQLAIFAILREFARTRSSEMHVDKE